MKLFASLIVSAHMFSLLGAALPAYAANPIQSDSLINLEIPLPNLKPEDLNFRTGNAIPSYIKAAYEFGVRLAAVLAFVMLVYSGVMWLTAGGDKGRVGEAQKIMTNSIAGLVLALGSVVFLSSVGTQLAEVKKVTPKGIAQLGISPSGGAVQTSGSGGGSGAGGGGGGGGGGEQVSEYSFNNNSVQTFTEAFNSSVEIDSSLIQGSAPGVVGDIMNLVNMAVLATAVVTAIPSAGTSVPVGAAVVTALEVAAIRQAPTFISQVAIKNIAVSSVGTVGKLSNPGILMKTTAECAKQPTACKASLDATAKVINTGKPEFLMQITPNMAKAPSRLQLPIAN